MLLVCAEQGLPGPERVGGWRWGCREEHSQHSLHSLVWKITEASCDCASMDLWAASVISQSQDAFLKKKIILHLFVSMWEELELSLLFGKKKKKQRHYFANKGPSSQSCGFSSGHVWT